MVRLEKRVKSGQIRTTHIWRPILKCHNIEVVHRLKFLLIVPVSYDDQTEISALYIFPYLQDLLLRQIILNIDQQEGLVIICIETCQGLIEHLDEVSTL